MTDCDSVEKTQAMLTFCTQATELVKESVKIHINLILCPNNHVFTKKEIIQDMSLKDMKFINRITLALRVDLLLSNF